MDLIYLFYRQQIERSMADAANSEAARKIHAELATEYEKLIGRAASSHNSDEEARPFSHWRVPETDPAKASKLNPTMEVAVTAREVDAN